MRHSAASLYERAVADANAGRPAAALRGLAAARQRSPDPDLEARIDGTLAYLEAETADSEPALERIRAAAGRPGLSSRTRAVLLGQAGLVAMRRGETDAALRDLGRAIARLRDDPPRLGRLALNRGDVHLQRGDLRRAADDFAVARDAFAAGDLPVEEAKAQHNLGYTALLAGDLLTAIREMDAARAVLADVSPVVAATCDADRATAMLAAGMPHEGARLLDAAIRCYGRSRLRQEQAEAELLLARTLVHTDPARAAVVARRAAARFRARGAESWAIRADGWALSAAAAGGTPGLADRLDAAAQRLRGIGANEDATRLRVEAAGARLAAGDPVGAAAALRRAAPARSAPIPLRLLAAQVRADLAAARGRPLAVLATASAGLDELARVRAALGSVDLQTSLLLHARPLLERGLGTALELDRPELLLEWTERVRDVVAQVPSLGPDEDDATAADLAEVRRLRAFGDGRAEAELVARLRDRSWHESGRGVVRAGAALAPLRARLGAEDATAIAFCRVRGALAAVVVDPAGARIVRLGGSGALDALLAGLRADLELAADAPTGPLGAGAAAALAERLAAIDRQLIAPLGLAADRAVVLSVPGALSGLPWAMLPGLTGRPVTVPPSLAEWVAGPPRSALRSAGLLAGPRVPRAEEEVAAAGAAWPHVEVLTGGAADVRNATALAERVDVLHVAAHGRHSAEQPLFSGVELADGPWFGHDVRRLHATPSVVILSACEVGRSATTWGEETVGLARAWLHAGARCVIASAASVSDDVACTLLPLVHRRLAAGATPAEALAPRPSTFVCFGDGLGRVGVSGPPPGS